MITANEYRTVLFLSPRTVKNNTIIGEEVNEDMIRVAVRQVQDIDLNKIIGSALLQKLQQLIAQGTIAEESNTAYKVLLDEYILPYMQSMVVASISFDLAYKWRNKGVITTSDERIENTPYDDVARLVQKHKVNAAAYREYLVKFLCAHSNDYPELCSSCDCGALASPTTSSVPPVPFYLG